MIAYLEGNLVEKDANACVVATTGGVGYELFLPVHTFAQLPERGKSIKFYTYLVVREDAQELFGFDTWEERQLFLVLLSISKVGARTALSILSTFRPEDIRRLVFEEDIQALTQVPGIGKKSAQHIFLELKYKVKSDPVSCGSASPAPRSVYRDVLTGLEGLGYTESEAAPLLKTILQAEPDLDVSGALRATLKALAKDRG